jgi:hypothetical protein
LAEFFRTEAVHRELAVMADVRLYEPVTVKDPDGRKDPVFAKRLVAAKGLDRLPVGVLEGVLDMECDLLPVGTGERVADGIGVAIFVAWYEWVRD